MPIIVILYCLFVFLIEMTLFYSPLYYISYGVFKFDRRIGDSKAMVILLLISGLLSLLFFSKASNIVQTLFF